MKLKTTAIGTVIEQEITEGSNILSKNVMDVKEKHVRLALLRLGWLPPVGMKRDPSMKYIYQKDTYWYAAMPASNGKPKIYLGNGRGGTFSDAVRARDEYLADNNLPPIE